MVEYLQLMKKVDPKSGDDGEEYIENVSVVEDAKRFVTDAAAYVADYVRVVLKNRAHLPGDPGVGWSYDPKTRMFSAPHPPAAVDADVVSEKVAAEELLAWKAEDGEHSAKRIDADTWVVRAPGAKPELVASDALEKVIAENAITREATASFAHDDLCDDKARADEVSAIHEAARDAKKRGDDPKAAADDVALIAAEATIR